MTKVPLTFDNLRFSFTTIQIAFAVLFAAAYRQQALYSGNQHTKFLHAAAQANVGHLRADWTAQTVDPLPAFTLIVRYIYEYLPVGAFYGLFALLAGIFAYSAVGIAGIVHQERTAEPVSTELALVFGSLLLLFNMLVISPSRGVAGQYMLTEELQPCVFGVFIFLSLYLWMQDRRLWAAISLAIAPMLHPGAYLLTSVLVLVSLLVASRRKLTLISAGAPLALFVLLVSPLMAYQAMSLAPTTPEAFARATQILANDRIPRHTDVALWFDFGDAVKFASMAFACWLVRRQPQLFWSLTTLTVFGFVSSMVLLIWPNAGARFATPWRVTAVAMPLATIILSYSVSAKLAVAARNSPNTLHHFKRGAAVAFLALSAIVLFRVAIHYARPHPTATTLTEAYARKVAADGQQYLVPPGMSDFRMATGLPTYVTFKTHPYKDIEVLDWWGRINAAGKIYELASSEDSEGQARELLDSNGITHVVVPAASPFTARTFSEVYSDANYKIYARRN